MRVYISMCVYIYVYMICATFMIYVHLICVVLAIYTFAIVIFLEANKSITGRTRHF